MSRKAFIGADPTRGDLEDLQHPRLVAVFQSRPVLPERGRAVRHGGDQA